MEVKAKRERDEETGRKNKGKKKDKIAKGSLLGNGNIHSVP